MLGGLLSPDNSISFRGPIVFSNILIGRALCFAFVQSVIKFPRGFSTRPPPLSSSQEFHPFRKIFPWVQQVNKQTLQLVSSSQSPVLLESFVGEYMFILNKGSRNKLREITS